jgi:hypothetical protein
MKYVDQEVARKKKEAIKNNKVPTTAEKFK